MNYYDYFEEEEHVCGEVSLDEFIAEATRKDIQFLTQDEELQFLRMARTTLINELFTCYEYLKERNLIELYQTYRNGEELPFK